jgi:hypothetical protein
VVQLCCDKSSIGFHGCAPPIAFGQRAACRRRWASRNPAPWSARHFVRPQPRRYSSNSCTAPVALTRAHVVADLTLYYAMIRGHGRFILGGGRTDGENQQFGSRQQTPILFASV